MKPERITPEQLTTLRHELARLLGAGWSHKADYNHTWHNTMITGPQGAVITVSRASDDGMVIIGGWSENFGETSASVRHTMPTIRVSYARGAVTIHKEIARRFLPDFYKALKAADTYVAERDDYRAKSGHTFDALFATFALCKGKPRHQRNDEGGGMIHFGTVGEGYGDVRVNSANSVDFTVKSMSRERAIKLAAFLTSL